MQRGTHATGDAAEDAAEDATGGSPAAQQGVQCGWHTIDGVDGDGSSVALLGINLLMMLIMAMMRIPRMFTHPTSS